VRAGGGWLRRVLGAVAVAAALGGPSAAAAQQEPAEPQGSLFERLYLDRLRLSALGVSAGAVKPTQMVATEAYALNADYGEIVPHWRVAFSATYWRSRLNDRAVQRYVDTLRTVIIDPSGDDTLDFGRITVQDIALAADLRWSPRRGASTVLRPYAGGGFAAHILNAEGEAIAGTFVERALDNITAGIGATAGLDIAFFNRVSVGMQARYDLLSGARFGSVRLTGNYLFRPVRVPARR
jgi:hypothetical protein